MILWKWWTWWLYEHDEFPWQYWIPKCYWSANIVSFRWNHLGITLPTQQKSKGYHEWLVSHWSRGLSLVTLGHELSKLLIDLSSGAGAAMWNRVGAFETSNYELSSNWMYSTSTRFITFTSLLKCNLGCCFKHPIHFTNHSGMEALPLMVVGIWTVSDGD